MTIRYKSVASNDFMYQHLPEMERPELLSAYVFDEAGNVFLFLVDESRTVKSTDLLYSEMANGNRYGDWGELIKDVPSHITSLFGCDKSKIDDDVRAILKAVDCITNIPAQFVRNEVVTIIA